MSDLGDELERIISRPGGGGVPLRQKLQDMLAHYGSGRKAAKAMGVNESTFRRMLSGQTRTPTGSTVERVDDISRRLGARRITNADISFPVTERVARRGKASRRPRQLRAGNLGITDPAAAGRIRQAYVEGGKENAARQFLAEVKVPHYRDWLTPDDLRAEMRDQLDTDEGSDYGYAVG
jgi:hypothetical protein